MLPSAELNLILSRWIGDTTGHHCAASFGGAYFQGGADFLRPIIHDSEPQTFGLQRLLFKSQSIVADAQRGGGWRSFQADDHAFSFAVFDRIIDRLLGQAK